MSLPPHDPLLNARRAGYTRSGFGAALHETAEQALGCEGLRWYVSCRVRVGVR